MPLSVLGCSTLSFSVSTRLFCITSASFPVYSRLVIPCTFALLIDVPVILYVTFLEPLKPLPSTAVSVAVAVPIARLFL